MPFAHLRGNTIFLTILLVTVVTALVFHAVEHNHIHPVEAASAGTAQSIQSHTHTNGATHTHHANAAAESTTQEALAEIGYTFHYRESEETFANLLAVIAFGAFALFSFFSIERIQTRSIVRNATEGTHTNTVLAPHMNIRFLDPLFMFLRRGICMPQTYNS